MTRDRMRQIQSEMVADGIRPRTDSNGKPYFLPSYYWEYTNTSMTAEERVDICDIWNNKIKNGEMSGNSNFNDAVAHIAGQGLNAFYDSETGRYNPQLIHLTTKTKGENEI